MLKIVIVDDESIIRHGIKLILEEDNEIEVVGMAVDGMEAFNICKNVPVDLVLMDLYTPNCNGIEGTKLIKEYDKSIKIIILTTFYDEENILNALNNGADGYLLKDIDPRELISSIKSTVNGLKVVHQNVFTTVLKRVGNPASNNLNKDFAPDMFNENEIKIIKLVVQGKTNKNIGLEMHLSEGRIRNIITEILGKLYLKDRIQLAVFAVRNNII
jgi:DNA-binding NarL/FixJ family response regulator